MNIGEHSTRVAISSDEQPLRGRQSTRNRRQRLQMSKAEQSNIKMQAQNESKQSGMAADLISRLSGHELKEGVGGGSDGKGAPRDIRETYFFKANTSTTSQKLISQKRNNNSSNKMVLQRNSYGYTSRHRPRYQQNRHPPQVLTISSLFKSLAPLALAATCALFSVCLIASAQRATMLTGSAQAPKQLDLVVGGGNEDQLQLLQSANVDLARSRGQRLQRDTNAPPLTSTTTSLMPTSGAASPTSGHSTCGYPGSPAHASVTFNTSHVVAGTAASYTCDNGYELLGPPRRICQANGTWSPIGIPFCVLNVGLGKAAMQSSTAGQGSAQKAVDGSTTPYFQSGICTMTDVEHSPWWYVNLLEPYLVQIVRIDFGTACCANRQKATIAVRVGNNRPDLGNNPLCNRYHGFIEEGKPLFLPCTRPAPGAFVSIHLEAPSGSPLSICETFIYTDHALSIEQCPSFRDQPLGSTATYNGKCYLFHNNQALNFDGARKYCESRGGTLVDETSPALQGFLSWELYRRHRNDQLMGQYWLGAVRDTRNPTNWKWINGKDVQISFWNTLNSQGNCSRFDGSKGWLWSDTDCNTNLNFICQYRPLSCGKPEKPTNSTLITKNVDNGTVIEYQCAPGNLLMGPKSRACLPTGFFSEFAPKCKYLDCQFPATIPNGDYKLLNGTTSYQSIVTYFCNEGYQLYGKATLTCDVDERWNGPPPRCEPLLCPAPVPPSNGYVTVTSNITIPGTQATYDCRPGYELVGDRLLSCLQSGSWDNSFPYCREKRNQMPQLTQLPPTGLSPKVMVPIGAPSQATNNQRVAPNSQSSAGSRPAQSGGNVQFPGRTTHAPVATTTVATAFASTPITTTTTTTSTTSLPPTATAAQSQPPVASTSPASLNGLAGQFVSQNSSPTQPLVHSVEPQLPQLPAMDPTIIQNSRRPPQQLDSVGVSSTQQPSPVSRSRPSQSISSTQSPTVFNSNRQQTSSSTSNRFPFGQPVGQQQQNGGHFSDSSPVATSNSVSVHSNQNQQMPSQQQPTTLVSTTSSSTTGSASSLAPPTTITTLATPIPALSSPSTPHSHHHSHATGNHQPPVLASSFGSPSSIRSHNSLATTRYSLDGIIAVAIFGGFLFLGAIITVLVIIVRRRKKGHSSTIDAQTISTYDSNGEHNGLYRNYQQAWENLRFASPNSQPKTSGNAGLITAHVTGGPSMGMKNFASPAVAMVHHAHHPMHAHHVMHGHHNLAMDGSTTSSSQSSSLGGANGVAGGGVDPLLRRHHVHHHAHHHSGRMAAAQVHQELDVDDDEESDGADGGDQGILSSDEVNAGGRLHHHHYTQEGGEGFRDTNELTINAETVAAAAGQQAAQRHRLYSANSMSRRNPMVAASGGNRLSMGNLSNMSAGHHHKPGGKHHHHHHSHHHLGGGGGSSAASSGHQRLVSSSTPSASTRSSQASPPSDDHSLEQLAYGNSWHPTGAVATNGQVSDSGSSGHNQSAGSGASILGNSGRSGNGGARYQ